MKCRLCESGILASHVEVTYNKEVIIECESLLLAERLLSEKIDSGVLGDFEFAQITLFDKCNKCNVMIFKYETIYKRGSLSY